MATINVEYNSIQISLPDKDICNTACSLGQWKSFITLPIKLCQVSATLCLDDDLYVLQKRREKSQQTQGHSQDNLQKPHIRIHTTDRQG